MILVVAKGLGLLGTMLISVPVIRGGRLLLVFEELGKTASSPELVNAIDAIKRQNAEFSVKLKKAELRYLYVGLSLIFLSFLLDLVSLL